MTFFYYQFTEKFSFFFNRAIEMPSRDMSKSYLNLMKISHAQERAGILVMLPIKIEHLFQRTES